MFLVLVVSTSNRVLVLVVSTRRCVSIRQGDVIRRSYDHADKKMKTIPDTQEAKMIHTGEFCMTRLGGDC